MTLSLNWAIVWLVAAAIIALIVTLWDKNRARRREWRVQESSLWLIALLGGAAAMFITMLVVRHKTRHTQFMVGLPLLTLLQAGLIFLLLQTNFLILT